MIRAAAEGRPFRSPRGTIYMTPELVEKVLGGLDGSISRFRKLINPKWESRVTERRYPTAHVAILSETAFSVERKTLTAENGRTVHVTMLTSRPSSTTYQAVTFSHYGAVWANPKSAIIKTVKGAVKGAGAVPSRILATQWRGRLSATAVGAANTSEGRFYTSVRVVELRKQKGALLIVAVSPQSQIDADSMREQLELSTQIID